MKHSVKPVERRGFALLAVLSVMVSVIALGAALSETSTSALEAIRNRTSLRRASWLAEGCLGRARASIDAALSDDRSASAAWQALDSVVASSSSTVGCSIDADPTGLRLDVNSSSELSLGALLAAAGVPSATADSIIDALNDWRDSDDETRPRGAESAWYEAAARPAPRNAPFAALEELRLVRGVEHDALDTLLGVERERIWLDRAPVAVIAALPGMTLEALGRIVELRRSGKPLPALAAIADGLSRPGRDSLLANYAQLVHLTTSAPDAWVLSARAASGTPPTMSLIEVRLVRAGARAAVVRRRTWL